MSAAEAKLNDEKQQEGREAFERGIPVESCPYESAFDLKRWAWIWGWHDSANIKKAKEQADRAFLLEAERRGFVPKPPPPESEGLDLEALVRDFETAVGNLASHEAAFQANSYDRQEVADARKDLLDGVRRLRAGAEGGDVGRIDG